MGHPREEVVELFEDRIEPALAPPELALPEEKQDPRKDYPRENQPLENLEDDQKRLQKRCDERTH